MLSTLRLSAPSLRRLLTRLAVMKNNAVNDHLVPIQLWTKFRIYSPGCYSTFQLSKQFHVKERPSVSSLYRSYSDLCTEEEANEVESQGFLTFSERHMSRSKDIAIQHFNDFIEKKGSEEWTATDWQEVEAQLSSVQRGPWEATCMQVLYNSGNLYVARSLMSYLKSKSDGPINRFTLVHYFAVLVRGSNGDKELEKEYMKLRYEITSELDELDHPTARILLKGMSWSRDLYKEGLKLVEHQLQGQDQLNNNLTVDMMLGCLRFNDIQTLEKVLEKAEAHIESKAMSPYITEIVEVALKANNQIGLMKVLEVLERLRGTFQRHHLDQVVEVIKGCLPNHSWNVSKGWIDWNSGRCNCCGHQMERVSVSDEDFAMLREAFTDQVIIGKNLMYKSSPKELQDFQRFLKKSPKFDVVIDGMNLLFKYAERRSEHVVLGIKYFLEQNKQVLVLGLKANKLLRRAQAECEGMHPKPIFFMTHTTRSDDAFYLLAAMHSGKNTLILSKDKLRDHRFLLDPSLRNIFSSWLCTSQLHSFWFTKQEEFRPGRQDKFYIGPAQDDGGYHFPIYDFDYSHTFGRMSILCLRNGEKQSEGNRSQKRLKQLEHLNMTTNKASKKENIGDDTAYGHRADTCSHGAQLKGYAESTIDSLFPEEKSFNSQQHDLKEDDRISKRNHNAAPRPFSKEVKASLRGKRQHYPNDKSVYNDNNELKYSQKNKKKSKKIKV